MSSFGTSIPVPTGKGKALEKPDWPKLDKENSPENDKDSEGSSITDLGSGGAASGTQTADQAQPDFATRDDLMKLMLAISQGFQTAPSVRAIPEKFNLKDYMLSSEDKFHGKNVSDFLTRLDDLFETYLLDSHSRRIQVLVANVDSELLVDIKSLPGYEERDYTLLRRSPRKEYNASDDRQKKETAAYLQEIATQSAAGKLDAGGFIKEFKTY